jgi:predicted Zn-dependent protease
MDTEPFKSPDDLHLDAAETWLKQGRLMEANSELNRISPAVRRHPDFLAVRYKILAQAECWTECVAVAAAMARIAPQSSLGWLRQAHALHQLAQTRMAMETLQPALESFPDEIEIHQQLARYACVLGNLSLARQRLAEAIRLAREQKCFDECRQAILGEPAFKPFWKMFDPPAC